MSSIEPGILGVPGSVAPAVRVPDAERPDVIVVCVDTLRADHVTPELTPNLWRIVERGVHFQRAFAEFPLTVPFRVSAVTGTYTFTNRPWSGLRPSDRHVAEIFAKVGYRTAAFTDTPFRSDVGLDRGFEVFEEFPGKLRAVSADTPGVEPVNRPDVATLPEPWIPDHRTDDRARWATYRDGWLQRRAATDRAATVGIEALVDGAIDWLAAGDDTAAEAAPSFLWLDTFECHEPWLSPTDEALARSCEWPWERFLPLPPGPDADWATVDDLDQVAHLYRGEVAHTDRQLGRLVDRLDELDRWDETVVVVMSDHGVPLGEHGRIRKYDVPLHDEMARIAWIVAAPGCTRGHRSDELVQTPDLLATLVELCDLDVEPPTAFGVGVDFPGGIEGHSLVPALSGGSGTRVHAFLGVFGTRAAIVRWPYKFVDRRGECRNELFDLECDPDESTDLLAERPDEAAALHHQLWRFQGRWARALRV